MKLEEIHPSPRGARAFSFGDLKILYKALPASLLVSCEHRPPSEEELHEIKQIFLFNHVKVITQKIEEFCYEIKQLPSKIQATIHE